MYSVTRPTAVLKLLTPILLYKVSGTGLLRHLRTNFKYRSPETIQVNHAQGLATWCFSNCSIHKSR